jgi:hypothetical protein
MSVSRRELIAYGTAGALTALTKGRPAIAEGGRAKRSVASQVPMQVATDRSPHYAASGSNGYDMRDDLKPRRLTIAMWDVAYALRHGSAEASQIMTASSMRQSSEATMLAHRPDAPVARLQQT